MRVLGITLPENKKIKIGLTVLYGIGLSRALSIIKEAGADPEKKVSEISTEEENKIRKVVEGLKIEGDLKREISSNVKRLKDIKCFRGLRHIKKLPCRGQRTKTNSRTLRGNTRKTMGTGRKVADKK